MTKPAARGTDPVSCAIKTPVPHGAARLVQRPSGVNINGLPAACVTDRAQCQDGSANFVAAGAPAVNIGGRPAARRSDPTFHGGTIEGGSPDVFIGGAAGGAWTFAALRELLCSHDPAFMRRLRADITSRSPPMPFRVLGPDATCSTMKWNGTAWEEHRGYIYGYVDSDGIRLHTSQSTIDAVDTLYHEHYHYANGHTNTPTNEYDTRVATEQWRIDHGLPGYLDYRTVDAAGRPIVNRAAIKRDVEGAYGPLAADVTDSPKAARTAVLTGHDPDTNESIWRLPDDSLQRRPPKMGDMYPAGCSEPVLTEVDAAWLTCG